MTARHFRILMSLLTVALLGALPVCVYAGGKGGGGGTATPLTAIVYNTAVDEQDTTSFYHDGEIYCSGATTGDIESQAAMFTGDSQPPGPLSAYDGFGSPWTTWGGLSSTLYVDGADCASSNSCLRVQFNSNNKTLTIDTRDTLGPSGPRTLSVALDPCIEADGCPGLGTTPSFGSTTTQPMIMNVFLSFPYTQMSVCNSAICPEAQEVFAKLWFLDPTDASVTWRVDWVSLRMLRMSENTWYLIAGICDGTEVAGLSKLTGSRTRPKTIFNGYFKTPFFIALVR